MSMFGKILAIVNVLAVIGVLALLGMNYAKRLSWEFAVFRQDLMINGLPVDDKDDMAGDVTSQTQQDIFNKQQPVGTQKAELDRVQQELTNKVQAAGDIKKQIAALASILMPMAETIDQRRRMFAYQAYLFDDKTFAVLTTRLRGAHNQASTAQPARDKPYEERFRDALNVTFSYPPGPFGDAFVAIMKANPKTDFDTAVNRVLEEQHKQLQDEFQQMFRNAFNGGAGVQPGAPAQQRRTIARLLFNMIEILSPPAAGANPDLSDPAYKRFFLVVGVKAGVEAINDQAGMLQELTFETQAERRRERGLFAVGHRKAVSLVLDKKTEVDQHTLSLANQKKEKEAHATTLARRRQDVNSYEQQLATERRKAAQNLQQLHKMSELLLTERVKLREISDDNQKLEKQIRALETGR